MPSPRRLKAPSRWRNGGASKVEFRPVSSGKRSRVGPPRVCIELSVPSLGTRTGPTLTSALHLFELHAAVVSNANLEFSAAVVAQHFVTVSERVFHRVVGGARRAIEFFLSAFPA